MADAGAATAIAIAHPNATTQLQGRLPSEGRWGHHPATGAHYWTQASLLNVQAAWVSGLPHLGEPQLSTRPQEGRDRAAAAVRSSSGRAGNGTSGGAPSVRSGFRPRSPRTGADRPQSRFPSRLRPRRRGRSSVGRALASQAKGRGFEARRPLQAGRGMAGDGRGSGVSGTAWPNVSSRGLRGVHAATNQCRCQACRHQQPGRCMEQPIGEVLASSPATVAALPRATRSPRQKTTRP